MPIRYERTYVMVLSPVALSCSVSPVVARATTLLLSRLWRLLRRAVRDEAAGRSSCPLAAVGESEMGRFVALETRRGEPQCAAPGARMAEDVAQDDAMA